MFGVCDGHGINGHMVSDFVKKNLPRILSAMFVQVISNGRKKHRKGASKVMTIAQKEDVVLPPLVKNQKAASSNFQSFHVDPSGEESSSTD
jgi:serine/threonine protein phosphatase PrpC